MDANGLQLCHKRKNGKLCSNKYSLELYTFSEYYCSYECSKKWDKPAPGIPVIPRKVPRKDWTAYAPEKGGSWRVIRTRLSGNLEIDRKRICYLYESLLSYTADLLRGITNTPPFPITQFAPAMVVTLFVQSGRAVTFLRQYPNLNVEGRKAVLQHAMVNCTVYSFCCGTNTINMTAFGNTS